MPRRIAIFVDKPDWHARRLQAAFAARGRQGVFVSLRDCGFRIGGGTGLALPGFGEALPDAAFVRCIPGGSFEQVTLRLGVLHALREAGVPVCNDARAIERCVDKSMTSFMLQQAGVPTPQTWVCETPAEAAETVAREAGPDAPLVLKPLFGSQGRGLKLIGEPAQLPPAEDLDGVFYLQRRVPVAAPGWRDFRVLVAGGRAIAAMRREGIDWITNAKQGADCEGVPLDPPLARLAVAASAAVGAGYAGVDIIRDREGAYLVLEVNSMPAWSSLQRVNRIDVTQDIVDAVLASGFAAAAPQVPPLREAAGD